MQTIAILGWGSLVWDPRDLPHYGPWKKDGPKLPIEFSRISGDSRLTLVIDLAAEVQCPTRFALSPRSEIADAVEDIRRREGTTRRHIGFYERSGNSSSRGEFPQQVDVIDVIRRWCNNADIDGIVWTALPSNFHDETGTAFSVDAGITYLKSLPKTSRENALKYIRNAPEEVDTPLRQRVAVEWPVRRLPGGDK